MGAGQSIYDGINHHLGKIGTVADNLKQTVINAKSAVASFTSTAGLGSSASGEKSGGFFDGGDEQKPLDSIIAYRQSKSHEAKQLLAQKIIEALKGAGVNVRENGDIADIAKAIMEKLPNPHKGQSYKIDSESQKNVLKALVKGLNDAFSPGASDSQKLIPTTYGLEEIARQAMELVYSMTTGVHDEFLTVQANVTNALHNVKVLRKLMDSAHQEVVSQANNLIANPERDTGNYDTYQEIYKRIAKECDRQIEMLSNMLDSTMGPEINVLQQLADETSADYKYIKKYVIGKDLDLKTAAFVIAHLVHAISATAVMYTKADKVFSELGGQMMHLKGATEEAVDKAIDELIRLDPSKAATYIKWKVAIKAYNAEQKVREATMEKHNLHNSNDNIRVRVGNAELFEERKSKYVTNYKKSTQERRLIFSDYISKSSALYAKLLAAVDAIGPRIGGEIPISDKLLDLREAFVSLSDEQNGLGGGSLEKSLIGFDLEIEGRQRRDAFMNKLRLVKTVLEQVVSMSVYSGVRQYFDPMVSAVNSMVEQADMYYDIVKQKYGSKEGGADGDEDDYQLPEVARSAHDLKKSVNSFVYYMYVAKVRENLKQTHSEVESYGEKYTQLLGEAVACRLKAIKTEYDNEIKSITDAFDAPLTVVKNAKDSDAQRSNYAYKVNQEKSKEVCKKYSKKQFECKKNFYTALQAVDLYLKEFTEGVTAHPEDIAEIKQMLTGVDLIGPWYDNKTGDNLAHGFDMFGNIGAAFANRPWNIWNNDAAAGAPAFVAAVQIGANPSQAEAKDGLIPGIDNPSFYKTDNGSLKTASLTVNGIVPNNVAAGGAIALNDPRDNAEYFENIRLSAIHLGDPHSDHAFNLMRADERQLAEHAIKRFSETYENFQALKNIVNAIVRMGDKFGNKELRNSVFMSPSEIFKNLMSYLKCSATSFEFKFTKNAARLPAVAEPAVTMDNFGLDGTVTARVSVGSVGANSKFVLEDSYFQMVVKAMATKVLTVIGVYDLFNRPGPVYDLTPTRMIIGGAVERPEIMPEATELYFRLTRLAEYYRKDAFKYGMSNDKQIGFIPDVSGVFSGFIKLMWLRFGETTVDQGSYSDSELQQLITEINSIYHHFKGESEHSVTSKACNEFVMEINRRYGIVKKSDFESYYKMIRETSSLGDGRDSYNNFAILPGEGELRAKKPAPSDMYLTGLGKDITTLDMKCEIKLDETIPGGTDSYYSMLKTFRNDLNSSFETARGTDYHKFVNISYSVRIKQAEAKMRKESENERYNTLSQLIRGSNGLASTDVARDFFFHETVVTGLNTLTAITKMLQKIRGNVDLMIGNAAAPDNIRHIASVAVVPAGGLAAAAPAVVEYNSTLGLSGRAGIQGVNLAAPGAGGAAANVATLLRDLIILVNGLNNAFGDKVKVRFPQSTTSQLLLDFTDLSNSLDGLMDATKYFINLMRQTMPIATIQKYEGTDSSVEGTYRWLEKNLSADLLQGKVNRYGDPMSANPDDDVQYRLTLAYITKAVDNMYTYIVHNFNTLQPAINELVFYNDDLTTAASQLAVVAPAATPLGTTGLDFLIADRPANRARNQNATPNRTYFNSIFRTWKTDSLDTTRSMMMLFNQLLGIYLHTFYDESSGKTYRGLIESFASGSFNQAVTSDGIRYVFSDLSAEAAAAAAAPAIEAAQLLIIAAVNKGNAPHSAIAAGAVGAGAGAFVPAAVAAAGAALVGAGIPAVATNVVAAPNVLHGGAGAPVAPANIPTNVLLQSLALILQRLMTDNTREGVSEHLISTLSEVPMFLREKMRAYLPVFSKMFNMVQQQGELIKQLLEQTDLTLAVANSHALDATNRNAMIACINKIVDGCYTLANSSSDVYRELADEPKYLQTQENSIRDYQSRYGKLPLMPISSVLNYLRIGSDGTETDMMPIHPLGTPEFKMLYGTRGLLNDHVWKSESAPGVSQALEQYRNSSNASVDDTKYSKLVSGVVGVVQSLVDLRYYVTLTSLDTVLAAGNANAIIAGAGGGAGAAQAAGILRNSVFKPGDMIVGVNNNLRVYQLGNNVGQPDTLSLTESSNQSSQLQKIVSVLGAVNGAQSDSRSRTAERMYNIIDMNIIPVNVHALMRGMPLAPLYNFTYTFEENARLALGIVGAVAEPATAREWFFKILEDPYFDSTGTTSIRRIENHVNGDLVNLTVGPNRLNMERPGPPGAGAPETAAREAAARAAATKVKTLTERVSVMLVGSTLFPARNVGGAITNLSNQLNALATALNPMVLNLDTLRDNTDIALRGAVNLSMALGAFSVPAGMATHSSNIAAITIAGNVPNYRAGLRAVFDNISVAAAGVAGAAGAPPAAGNLAAHAAELEAVANSVITGLVIARNLNLARLNNDMRNTINNAIARVLVTAPDADPTPADIDVVRDIDNAVAPAAAGNIAQVTAQRNAASLLGLLNNHAAAPISNILVGELFMRLVNISALTAAVNAIDRRPDRYNLNRTIEDGRTLASLMHGDETLLMGRPKFISDQLFHKVLPAVNEDDNLTYYAKGSVHAVPVLAANRQHLRTVFENRFNTRIVRNLMHCTNVQRVLRLRLNQELTSYRDVLVNRESITNPSVTEFGNLRWSDMRLDGTVNRRMDPRNEDARTRTYNSEDTVRIPR